jgi:ribosomal protein S18 acetylase RimI-like enzyme
MQIVNSTAEDIALIFEFYDAAIEFQKQVFNKHWKGFDHDLVAQEINENRQWKILVDGQVACIFAITFNDPSIWGERDQDDAIYIHRIVTHPDFRGRNLVGHIVEWARNYALAMGRQYVRLDTWGDNEKLIQLYQNAGFKFLGIITPDFRSLPKHYIGITLSLFEIKL